MPLQIQLDPLEARVFGVLVEKTFTTPDQVPLSLNATTNGANQKSNRHPVLNLSESDVAAALERLVKKYVARRAFQTHSRVEKFHQNGPDALGLSNDGELAVVAELLLRGPQTPGELRTHATRMTPIDSLEALGAILEPLQSKGFVRRLPPAPGSRAERYVQLLSPDLHPIEIEPLPSPEKAESFLAPAMDRIAELEREVERLNRVVRILAQRSGVVFDD